MIVTTLIIQSTSRINIAYYSTVILKLVFPYCKKARNTLGFQLPSITFRTVIEKLKIRM